MSRPTKIEKQLKREIELTSQKAVHKIIFMLSYKKKED